MADGFKTGGRTKGTPNKITAEMRQLLSAAVMPEIGKIAIYLEQITDPVAKLKAIKEILPYVLPRYGTDETTKMSGLPGQVLRIVEEGSTEGNERGE
jgi:hypothetical protein